jgi:hypothetical protein
MRQRKGSDASTSKPMKALNIDVAAIHTNPDSSDFA